MNSMINNTDNLKQRWQTLLQKEPHLLARNAAERLNVSEGELVACRCGDSVMRLRNDYIALLESLVKVGQVMTITRNDYVVHEKKGYYSNLQLKEHGGGAFDHNINLRIYFGNWAHVFAVIENGRQSIQIFDADGTAVHKIYCTDNSYEDAWGSVIARFISDNQSTQMITKPAYQPYIPQAKENVDVPALLKQWRAINDLHEFWFMLRDHQLTRLDALSLADTDLARRVHDDAWRTVFEHVRDSGLPIMVFVRSPGVAQIHTGAIHNIVEKDGWFNILDPSFNLHLRAEAVAQTWVVYRPCEHGGQTSLEMYDAQGELIFHLFGEVNLHGPELRTWCSLLRTLPSYTV